jgi:hypothetical protein
VSDVVRPVSLTRAVMAILQTIKQI